MDNLFLPPSCEIGSVSYRELAEHIRSLILFGHLAPGSKLPTIRYLAESLDTSNLTIHRAYQSLAESGFTTAGTGRGTFVATNILAKADRERLYDLIEEGRYSSFERLSTKAGIRSMSMGYPDNELLDCQELLAGCMDYMRDPDPRLFGFWPVGIPDMLVQAGKLLSLHGYQSSGEEILLTTGDIDAMSIIAKAFFPQGRPVLMQDPFIFGARNVIGAQGVRTIGVGFDHTGLDLAAIDDQATKLNPAAIFITPVGSMPTGAIMNESDALELVRLARKHDFYIVEIGSPRWITFEHPPQPLLKLAPERTFFIDTFTFSVAPGIRLGYLRCPAGWHQKLGLVIGLTHLGPSTLAQMACARYVESGAFKKHLARVVPKYETRAKTMVRAINTFMPGAKIATPRGGFTLWCDIGLDLDTEKLSAKALTAGVSYFSGSSLSDKPSSKSCIRLAYGTLPPEAINEAIKDLGAFFAREAKEALSAR